MNLEVDEGCLDDAPALGLMAVALALVYWGGALPLAPLPQILGLLVFAQLALLRLDLALLTVPATAPLYLIPVAVPGLRAEPLRFPLHELALLAAAVAAGGAWLWRAAQRRRSEDRGARDEGRAGERAPSLRRSIPHAMFLLAGLIGVLLAVPEGRGAALRELRWLVVEPLLFYALLRWQMASHPPLRRRAAYALVGSGAVVALIGLLQLVGLDVTPLLGQKQNFGSASVVEVDGLRRVTSVFGHPNNLGLFLGRAWPLAAALLLLGRRTKDQGRRTNPSAGLLPVSPRPAPAFGLWSSVFGLSALVMLAGLAASLSRGAWLGALAAAAVLALGLAVARGPAADGERAGPSGRVGRRPLVLGLSSLVILTVVAAVALTLRGGLGGGSVDARLLLWREALALIQQHPLGVGLDGFYYYHNPEFGRSQLDPALAGTSEQFASHPHNLLLDAWLNVGPLGLAALTWLVIHCYRSGIRSLRRGADPIALGALAALTAGLVHGSVDVFYFVEDLALVFWLLLAISEGPPDHS